jgi:RNA polymerase sigma-70 factor (ECF subfamily)
MANRLLGNVLQYLRRVGRTATLTEPSDGRLLERFLSSRDEAAFEMLVERHGAMVLGVCRRLLNHAQDAEDAFQATFLVLARKGGSIRKQESVGSWLYGVAFRCASRLKAATARRRAHERQAGDVQANSVAELPWQDLRPILDEELNRLPEKYRAPVVLCYLEGKTNEQAAEHLGWTKGTVSGRLARARALLRARLVRRGLSLSGAALAALCTPKVLSAAPTIPLVVSTVRAAALIAAGKAATAAGVSAQAAALTEGVLQTMVLSKLKTAMALLLAVILLGAGVGVVTYGIQAGEGTPAKQEALKPALQGKGKGKGDKEKIQGTWVIESAKMGGKDLPEEETKGMKMVFAGDKVTVTLKGEDKEGTFKLDPSKKPKEIDVEIKGAPNAGEGIYQLEGDKLTLCIDDAGKQRPTEFKSEEGTRHGLIVLKREAKGKDKEEGELARLKLENERLRKELQKTKDELLQTRKELVQQRQQAEEARAVAEAAQREAQAQRDQAERARRAAEAQLQKAQKALDRALEDAAKARKAAEQAQKAAGGGK